MVELLQDDDMSVRESMAGGVTRHLQKHSKCLMELIAQHISNFLISFSASIL